MEKKDLKDIALENATAIGTSLGVEMLKYICLGMLEDMKKAYHDKDEKFEMLHREYTDMTVFYIQALDEKKRSILIYDLKNSMFVTFENGAFGRTKDYNVADVNQIMQMVMLSLTAVVIDEMEKDGEDIENVNPKRFILVPIQYADSILF